MKILALFTVLLSVSGCPSRDRDGEVDTRITLKKFNDGLGMMEIGYNSDTEGARFQCKVKLTGGNDTRNDQSWGACEGNPLQIPMAIGERLELQVRAITADNRVDVTPSTVTYVHGANPGGSHTLNTLPTPPVLQVGIAHEFQVPQGMHITQYATNNNYQGVGIELVRLQQGQDANYLGSYPLQALGGNGCSTFSQAIVSLSSPGARTYRYCQSFLDAGDYFNMFSGNYARNHIEVASDGYASEMQPGSRPQSRLLVQTYGPQEENMIRNRFNDLCHPSRAIGPESRFASLPMIEDFWLAKGGLTVRDTHVCTVKLGGLHGGLFKVGGFTALTPVNNIHHRVGCSAGSCGSYAKFISVVYMERVAGGNGIDQEFARNFQKTLVSSLRRNRPL